MTRKLGLNLQPLAAQHMTGIGVYTKEVAKRLPLMLRDDIAYDMHVFDFLGRNHAEELVRKNMGTTADRMTANLSDMKTDGGLYPIRQTGGDFVLSQASEDFLSCYRFFQLFTSVEC